MTTFAIPPEFWAIRYDGRRIPGAKGDFAQGANCQLFAYSLLAAHGRPKLTFRSKELWEDTVHTRAVDQLEPLDLLLFNTSPEAFGAHVAVYIGQEQAIHLSKRAGVPEIWPLSRFAADSHYHCFIGAKRVQSLPE